MSLFTKPKKWLEKSIQDGRIGYYQEEDLVRRNVIGCGRFGTVYKATVKQLGIPIVVKPLLLEGCNWDEKLYSLLVKEVSLHSAKHICCCEFILHKTYIAFYSFVLIIKSETIQVSFNS